MSQPNKGAWEKAQEMAEYVGAPSVLMTVAGMDGCGAEAPIDMNRHSLAVIGPETVTLFYKKDNRYGTLTWAINKE